MTLYKKMKKHELGVRAATWSGSGTGSELWGFMSGDLGSYTEERLRNLGAAAVFPKPFHLPEVAQRLWEVADEAELSLSSV